MAVHQSRWTIIDMKLGEFLRTYPLPTQVEFGNALASATVMIVSVPYFFDIELR